MRKVLLALLVALLVCTAAGAGPRFSVSNDGVIKDSQTGLEWVVGPDEKFTEIKAEAWLKECRIAGGGWRMPTLEELKKLAVKGLGTRNMDPVFKTTGYSVLGTEGEKVVRLVFHEGEGGEYNPSVFLLSVGDARVFGVRSAKK